MPRFLGSLVEGPIHRSVNRSAVDVSQSAESNPLGLDEAPDQDYIFFLRSFGNDGGVRIGDPAHGRGYTEDTLEALLCTLAQANELATFAFQDHGARRVPAQVNYYTSDHDDWARNFQVRSRSASVIIAITPGKGRVGESFLWELEELRRASLDHKVILVSPATLNRRAHRTKERVCEALGWPVPPAVFLVAYLADDGRLALQQSLGEKDVNLATTYRIAVGHALAAIGRR